MSKVDWSKPIELVCRDEVKPCKLVYETKSGEKLVVVDVGLRHEHCCWFTADGCGEIAQYAVRNVAQARTISGFIPLYGDDRDPAIRTDGVYCIRELSDFPRSVEGEELRAVIDLSLVPDVAITWVK